MPLLVPDVGEVNLLSRMVNKIATGDVKLRLFKNNYTPVEAATAASFTQANAAGYAEQTLTGATWTVATNAGVTEASYPERTFNFTAADTIYGYYVVDSAGTTVLWAERFDGAPFNIPAGGGSVKVTPRIRLE